MTQPAPPVGGEVLDHKPADDVERTHPGTGVESVGTKFPADGEMYELVVDDGEAGSLAAAEAAHYAASYADPHPIAEVAE